MSPEFWSSIGMTVGVMLGALFFISLMIAATGVTRDESKTRRGGGFVE